ncbi:MAG: SDR family oxidoreductase [Chlorobium sp.]|nr:SDR family oxidoreductase [Chlorobium sp.]MCW8818712.1 SDR family oxidoreductase [Ignavibacteriaceae bacterium]
MEKNRTYGLGVVITGGTGGLGYALAREFLLMGDRVLITGRDQTRLEQAIETLKVEAKSCEVYGICRDVCNADDLALFRSFIVSRLGQVDRWINNAGTAGMRKAPLWELDAPDILETCNTNLFGSLLMSRTAIEIMSDQPAEDEPVYHVFNLGFSSTGANFSRSNIPHKASKLGVAAVSRFLEKELREQGFKGIGVHELSPGLVKTDLLFRDTSEETKEFLDCIAETPEKVAEKLVVKLRSVQSRKSPIRYRSIPGMTITMLGKLAVQKIRPLLKKTSTALRGKKR